MRIISRYSALVAFLLVLSQVANAAEPPTGFRNFKWGAPPSGKLKKTASGTGGATIYVPMAGKRLAPLFGLPVTEEAYVFSNGKFYRGMAWLSGKDNFEKSKSFLEKEYGKPSFANESIYLWKWKWPGSRVEVHLYYSDKFAKTTVTFANYGI
jgi:hypothetical protein